MRFRKLVAVEVILGRNEARGRHQRRDILGPVDRLFAGSPEVIKEQINGEGSALMK